MYEINGSSNLGQELVIEINIGGKKLEDLECERELF